MSPQNRISRRKFCGVVASAAVSPLIGAPANAAKGEGPNAAAAAPFDLSRITVPAPRREFRGVWIATVDNIDWPSRRDLTTDQQKAELLTLLDRATQLNLNAILLQVRPACDALYASSLEPWSAYLTGQMGKAPDPFYDPLEFAVTEAHKRGLELHAWFNPFRVRQSAAGAPPAPNHVSQTHPEWVRTYGKMLWLDPGEKAARDYSLAVFADVVKRYDIDGIHIDDYFYPYKITDSNDRNVEFPDDLTFTRYQSGGGTLSRADWRRSNIDDFVERMYADTKSAKPWVQVGISPFGIWRPGNPAQIKGFDSYEELYGDSRRWIHEGWSDYFTPQLYWKIEQTAQSFPVLLSWWQSENPKGRHIWPGLYTNLAGGPRAKWPQTEIEYQIKTTRGIIGADAGHVHFSGRFLTEGTIADSGSLPRHLSESVYAETAPVPESPWLVAGSAATNAAVAPGSPQMLTATPNAGPAIPAWQLQWAAGASATPWQWLVQWRVGGSARWEQAVISGSVTAFSIPMPLSTKRDPKAPSPPPDVAAVTAINRLGAAGSPTLVALPAIASPAP